MTGTMLATTPQTIATLNLAHCATVLESRMTRQLVHGLTLGELLLLVHLRTAAAGSLPRAELAARMGMSQANAARMLVPLERRALVQREAGEGGAAATVIRLAEEALPIVDEALQSAELAAEDLFATVDSTTLATLSALPAVLFPDSPGGFHHA